MYLTVLQRVLWAFSIMHWYCEETRWYPEFGSHKLQFSAWMWRFFVANLRGDILIVDAAQIPLSFGLWVCWCTETHGIYINVTVTLRNE